MADSNIELLAGVAEALGDQGDYLESHDLEDVLSVVDGRSEIVDEIAQAEPGLRRYVGKIFAGWLPTRDSSTLSPALSSRAVPLSGRRWCSSGLELLPQ